eukprot:GFUD01121321.1.p1 GENE.GFUD01121321.1~~GFUD01121321.1.p1  ORF type:complete len:258 (+),score=73.42 GFUD01121321.1:71-844(+)
MMSKTALPALARRCLSTSTSTKESAEALRHVQESEKKMKVPMLDRSRGFLTGKNYSYSIVGPKDVDTANDLLYDTYHPDEPITKYLGLTQGGKRIADADRMVQEIAPNACYLSELEDNTDKVLADVTDPEYKPLAAIHHELRLKNRHIYKELGTDKFFSIRMVGVENSQRGMGVATELIRRSILLAGCLGFSGIKTEATGNFSRIAFEAVGLLPTNTIKYEDFEYEGKKIFNGLNGDNTEITFMRKKFFQSCLKHII